MTYRIAISEAAEAEGEAIYLWLLRRSPETAAAWYEGLLAAIDSLTEFPRRCPVARESDRFEQEIRQFLYGSGRMTCRILFTIFEAERPDDEPTVRILHVRHGAQRDLGEEGDPEAA
jgi:plasmid stabilization system protein ParE